MNYVKRALISIWMYKGKTVILLALFFVVSSLLFTSICIMNASAAADKQAESSVGTEVTIAWKNVEKQPVPLSKSELQALSRLKHIKSFNYVDSLDTGVAVGFKMNIDEKQRSKETQSLRKSFKKRGRKGFQKYVPADIMLFGALDTSMLDQFLSGGFTLYSGRFIGKADYGKRVVMISKATADKNHLKLGDKIKIGQQIDPSVYTRFTIVGIFMAPSADKSMPFANNPDDYMFLSYPELGLCDSGRTEYKTANTVVSAHYFLDPPASLASFIFKAKK